VDAIDASSIHTSLIWGLAHTTIPRAAFFKKAAPCGFALESFCSKAESVTTTNSHEFFPLDVGARSKASTNESIFSDSTGLLWYFRMLLRLCAKDKNISHLLEFGQNEKANKEMFATRVYRHEHGYCLLTAI
jgi:hypothetical protein